MSAIGAEFELLLRRLIREEIVRILGGDAVDGGGDDDAELRQRGAERAARMRRARAAGGPVT